MVKAVDWINGGVFISLFVVVGAVQEVGLIKPHRGWHWAACGRNLLLAVILL